MNGLANREQAHKFYEAIRQTYEDERMQRQLPVNRETAVIQEAPDDDKAAEAEGLRLPRPYRRLRPAYTESAAAAEVEATVDVLADLDASGEVMNATVARWAGFGLDESTVETVKRLHFFPAMQNGAAIPIRVLLRYNFRKPPK
jgi:TonB family protein